MPFYEFICPKCGAEKQACFSVNGSHDVTCSQCGIAMKKNFQKMIPAYHDVPVDSVDTDLTGEPIVYHTRGQLKKIAKEHGCTVTFGASHKNHGNAIR